MPFGPNRESPKDKPLSDEECAKKIRELQEQQERILRRALSDELFEWLQDFERDKDVLGGD